MNTPAHLLLGAAAFGRGERKLIWAALAGSLLPDLSLYLLVGVSLYVLDLPAQTVFRELYYSDLWQTIFAIDNSVFLWSGVLALAVWRRVPWAIALAGAALLHIAFDLPLHHDDGRAHFWPFSDWIFESPFSYWDHRHGADMVAPVAAVLSVICAVLLWMRRPGWPIALVIAVVLAGELMVGQFWSMIFR